MGVKEAEGRLSLEIQWSERWGWFEEDALSRTLV